MPFFTRILILFLHVKAELEKTCDSFFFEKTCSYIKANQEYIALVFLLVVAVYIIEWIRYKIKIRKYVNRETVNLGQINIGGGLEKILNAEQIALVIRSEFSAIDQCLKTMAREQLNSFPAQASSEDYYYFFSGTKDNTAIVRQLTTIPTINGIKNQPVLQENITLGMGSFKIPVSDVLRSVIAYIGLFPIKPRKIYKRSLIHISLISYENNAKVVVHHAGANGNGGSHVLSVTSLSSFKSMDELSFLLRDMAFMVLELHNAFGKCHWKSMRYLMDGFNEFCRFRNSGLLEDRNKAKKSFYKAITIDPENNLEALYYSAVMLMVERTTDAIEKSINYFKNALRTEDQKFEALINLGLAFCYAQSYHRLGKRKDDMIMEANNAILKVEKYWNNRQKPVPHIYTTTNTDNFDLPLIPYIKAMIELVEGVSKEDSKEKENSIYKAIREAYKSHQLDPFNSMFINIIGWALMKLALSKTKKLPEVVLPKYKERNIALLSEKCLQEALILNPNNKLTHANLCLLYSIPFFRKRNKKDKYNLIYLASRFHGKKAVSIDKDYINGYRDLCLAYIRYGKVDEAEKCFHKALELAENPCKDAEIFRDIISEAEKNNIPKGVLKKWAIPQPLFFEPHERS